MEINSALITNFRCICCKIRTVWRSWTSSATTYRSPWIRTVSSRLHPYHRGPEPQQARGSVASESGVAVEAGLELQQVLGRIAQDHLRHAVAGASGIETQFARGGFPTIGGISPPAEGHVVGRELDGISSIQHRSADWENRRCWSCRAVALWEKFPKS